MDGAIIVDAAIKRLAWANVQLMPDPTIPSDETGTRHRTAERVAKQTGALVVSVSQQRETVTIFVGAGPLPARPGRRRAGEDEPGARDARHVPPAARAGADAADGARVPERRRPRRRARHPPACRDDLADGRADQAGLRRARERRPADPAPARGARRRRPGRARRDRPRLPRRRRTAPRRRSRSRACAPSATRICSSSTGWPSSSAIRAGVEPARPRRCSRAAIACSPTSRACRSRSSGRVVADLGSLDAVVRASQRDLEARRRRGRRPRARDPRRPPAPPGAQPRRPLSAAVGVEIVPRISKGFLLVLVSPGPAPSAPALLAEKRRVRGEDRLVQGRRQGGVSAPRCRDGGQEGVARGPGTEARVPDDQDPAQRHDRAGPE